MATFLMILQRKRPSSIIVTTLAQRPTSQTTEVTSPNMMHIFHTVNSLLMSIVAPKTCHISSTANSLMRKLACTIMVQDA